MNRDHSEHCAKSFFQGGEVAASFDGKVEYGETGCLTLLEILEIYWNNFCLLEIYWKIAKSPGNFLAHSKFLYFTVYQ